MKEFSTIIKSIVTEKSSLRQAQGQYTFLVSKSATKIDIKNAVKALYGADVAQVRIMISPKKTRMYGRRRVLVKRPVQKKAIVRLKDKQTIDPSKVLDHKPKKK